MKRWRSVIGFLLWASTCLAMEISLDRENNQQCSGMYSKTAWGGPSTPYILTTFRGYKPKDQNNPNDDPIIAMVIFEWTDEHLIGVKESKNSSKMKYICDDEAVEKGFCKAEKIGTYLLGENATDISRAEIKTRAIHIDAKNRSAVNYEIKKTGYYCISTAPFSDFDYTAIVVFKNAYGELPGAQIAKLPFYGGLTIVYAVLGVFWAFLYVQNRHDILPVQNYITATIIFLVVEMIATWGYYDHMNREGADAMSKVLLIIVAILNALRSSMSFFLLLIVCMGYGVVHGSLGKKMTYARGLAITHFVFGIIYGIASGAIAPEDAGPLVLLVVLPLAATLTAFYVWTLNSLSATLKDLQERKQRVKAQMYKRLWWCILSSVLVIFAFFFLNSFSFAGQADPNFTPTHWQTRWFVLDGWLNIVYLGDVTFIAYLWRPTVNNRRFAMSDELAQDDEGFEIASVRESLDDDEEEGGKPPAYDSLGSEEANGAPSKSRAEDARDRSPLPAPTPQRPAKRQSLEGDTIFAVGEDGDRFSDSEDEDDEERQGLRSSGKDA